jgi:hypothetical protein
MIGWEPPVNLPVIHRLYGFFKNNNIIIIIIIIIIFIFWKHINV